MLTPNFWRESKDRFTMGLNPIGQGLMLLANQIWLYSEPIASSSIW